MSDVGEIIILNGAPRSGKSSIATAILSTAPEDWVSLGVDQTMAETPTEFQPGIGLRPGGERPDLEPYVVQSYLSLYTKIAETAGQGQNVVVDVGHHDAYSRPLGIWSKCLGLLNGLRVTCVGVHCDLQEIMIRRRANPTGYETGEGDAIPEPVRRWQLAVHKTMKYDLEVDAGAYSADECAKTILRYLKNESNALDRDI